MPVTHILSNTGTLLYTLETVDDCNCPVCWDTRNPPTRFNKFVRDIISALESLTLKLEDHSYANKQSSSSLDNKE